MADDFAATTLTTGSVAVGGSITGRLETVGDRDWFSIILAAGNQYSFKLDSGSTDGLQDPYLRLFNIGGAAVLAENDDANGLGSQIDISITTTGTYYLEAGSGTNPDAQAVGTRMGNYILSASTSGDDYSANVSTTGRITAGGAAAGQLETAGDSDWFAISLIAGKQYVFTLNSGATDGLTDPLLSLYGSNGALLTSNDDSAGLNSEITITAATTGTYYLGASSGVNGSGTGSYSLNASLPMTEVTPPTTGDDYTANVSTTGRITVGGTATGQLETAGDGDWFAITLVAGTKYTLRLESGTTDGLVDPLLNVYNSAGALVTSNDDHDGLNSQVDITAPSSGTYYLGASSGSNGGGTGSYTLSALQIVDDYTATVSTSGLLGVGESSTGTLETVGDRDWFAIHLNKGQEYVFGVDSGSLNGLADPFLTLYNYNGTLISSNDDGNGANPRITYAAPDTGTYFLEASSSPNAPAGTGTYSIYSSLPTENSVTYLNGTNGNDLMHVATSSGVVDGGSGIDTVEFSGSFGSYSIVKKSTPTGYDVSSNVGNGGTVALVNVERFQFSDTKLALDLDGNAGTTAKIIGAVVGAASVSNKAYVGIGLILLDSGMSYTDLMQAALNAVGATNPAAVVNTLWTNLMGSAPSAEQAAPFVDALDKHYFSPGALGVAAAELDLNTTNINLVGLMQTGIEYS